MLVSGRSPLAARGWPPGSGRRFHRWRGRRRPGERRTLALGVLALAGTGAVGVGELGRVWKRGSAPLPAQTDDVLGAVGEAARQTVEVAVAGYREGSDRESALLNLLLSFTVGFGAVRALAHTLRARGQLGPLRNVMVGRRHIHHFVPGILMCLAAGGASIVLPSPRLSPRLAVPFGLGLALTLDESALLLELDDVYWTEAGVISLQISFAAIGSLSALALALRMLDRGERRVLDPADARPVVEPQS